MTPEERTALELNISRLEETRTEMQGMVDHYTDAIDGLRRKLNPPVRIDPDSGYAMFLRSRFGGYQPGVEAAANRADRRGNRRHPTNLSNSQRPDAWNR